MCDLLEPELFRKKAATCGEKNRRRRALRRGHRPVRHHEVEETPEAGDEKLRVHLRYGGTFNARWTRWKSGVFEGRRGRCWTSTHGRIVVLFERDPSGGRATGVGDDATKISTAWNFESVSTRVGGVTVSDGDARFAMPTK